MTLTTGICWLGFSSGEIGVGAVSGERRDAIWGRRRFLRAPRSTSLRLERRLPITEGTRRVPLLDEPVRSTRVSLLDEVTRTAGWKDLGCGCCA